MQDSHNSIKSCFFLLVCRMMRLFDWTYVCQSISGAAPDGGFGFSTHALAIAVFTVVLARLQLENTKTAKNEQSDPVKREKALKVI